MSNIYSHIHKNKPPEKLEEHKKLVEKYFQKILSFKNIDIEKITDVFGIKDKQFVEKLFYETVLLHDEGKQNPAFQYLKMKNEAFKDEYEKMDVKNSKHSFLGAVLFFKTFIKDIADEKCEKEFEKKLFLLVALSFLIAKHHSKLDNFSGFIERLKDELTKEGSEFSEFELNYEYFDIEGFIAMKLIFSLLISADYYATLEYMTDLKIDDFGKIDIKKAQEEFESFEIIKNIRNGNYSKPIDKLRSEMFLEAEQNLDLSKNIFYLQAPTGAGKTLISLNLALNLNPSKIFYVFPFNTLVEQTKDKISEIFKNIDFAVINSITPIKDEEDDKKQYERIYLNRIFYHYKLVLTTHINLFDTLFGVGKEANFPLWQLFGSVIILDEIQSYNNNLWWYMAEFFSAYAKILNLKIIIMSATLPKIDTLLENKDNFLELLDSRKYFLHTLFKNRVNIDFSLLEKEPAFEDLKEKVLESNKVLVEFIKKKSAREFYEYLKDLKDFEDYEIYELSGDDNKILRKYVIQRSKNAEKIVIIATQVIEAGVDIDMDLGLKDISTLDSDEQFIGRINRNAQKEGKAYFFNLDDEAGIYKGDNRIGFRLSEEKYQNIFLNKDFESYYKDVLGRIRKKGDSFSGLDTNINNFRTYISNLDYKAIEKEMRLINQISITVFFPYKLPYNGVYKELIEAEKEFLNEGYFDGSLVWQKLKELNEIENFAQKKLEKSKLNYYAQFFTFSVPYIKKISDYNDECCGIFLIEDCEKFIDENFKFDRTAFLNNQNKSFGFL